MTPKGFQTWENKTPGSPKVGPEEAERTPKGSRRIPEGNQKKAKASRKVARMRKVTPKSSRGAFVFCFYVESICQNDKKTF